MLQLDSDSGQINPNWLLTKGAEMGNITWICRAISLSADRNSTIGNSSERTPIHLAVLSVIRFQIEIVSLTFLVETFCFYTGISHFIAVPSVEWSQNQQCGCRRENAFINSYWSRLLFCSMSNHELLTKLVITTPVDVENLHKSNGDESPGFPTQVGLLLKSRADQNLADIHGNTPLKVAVNTANADIVSL